MITLHNVRKGFNLGKANEFIAVGGVTLAMEANRVTVLKGPSGSGKTTLLSLIGCMARPTSGRITPFIDPYQVAVLFFLTVVPYTVATIVPSWRAAIIDPDSVMRS